MKVVIQRVKNAWITVNGGEKQSINQGLVVLFGVEKDDTPEDTLLLAKKVSELRIFTDENDKMNLSANDLSLECLVASQFTLFADTKKGRRPSFMKSEEPVRANELYEKFLSEIKQQGFSKVIHGEFGADMQINLTNDGPITIIMDTKEWRNS